MSQLGGRVETPMMHTDYYREKVRKRAIELVEWILDSGDGNHLGLTREDVQTPLKVIKTGK